jgi:hypothetical protein
MKEWTPPESPESFGFDKILLSKVPFILLLSLVALSLSK